MKTGTESARLEGYSGRLEAYLGWIEVLTPDRVEALCVLPDGRLASSSSDKAIRLWNIAARREIARLEIDSRVGCLVALSDGRLVAGDSIGRLHWLEIIT